MFSFGNDVLGLGNLVGAIKGDNIVIAQNQNSAGLEAEKIKQAAKTTTIILAVAGGLLTLLLIYAIVKK